MVMIVILLMRLPLDTDTNTVGLVGHLIVVGKAVLLIVLPVGPLQSIHGKGLSLNAVLPILITLVGIVTDASDLHDKKASLPILVTLVGILTDTSDVHHLKDS